MPHSRSDHNWYLVTSHEFLEQHNRLPAKHHAQVAKKLIDLMSDPTPGGSKTALVGYVGLFRVRAGDYRIIYRFNNEVAEALSLAKRREDTYDDLDAFEDRQFAPFRSTGGKKPDARTVADWSELAKRRSEPKTAPQIPLPEAITEEMLGDLGVPTGYWPALLKCTTENGLLDCAEVPGEFAYMVLDRLLPKRAAAQPADTMLLVISKTDIVNPAAEEVAGPVDVPTRDEPSSGKVRIEMKEPRRHLPAVITGRPLSLQMSRQRKPMRPYGGNVAKGIGREAHYSVKMDKTIKLEFSFGDRERALLTTDAHPDLVEMVNQAKRVGSDSEAGRFLINEYRHVLVPTKKGVLYAGDYTRDLEFEFEKRLVSPVAPAGLKPGAIWPGPHAGVKYTLTAGAKDVRYEMVTPRGTEKRVLLSDFHSAEALKELLSMLRAAKREGGAIYINEARELLAPVDTGSGYKRKYIGHLGAHPWFPAPE